MSVRAPSDALAILAVAAATLLAQTDDQNDRPDKTGRDIRVANNSIIYEEPTDTSKQLAKLEAGETVHVLARAEGDFWEVEYGDIRGFLHDVLLADDKAPEPVSDPDLGSNLYRMHSGLEAPKLVRQVTPNYSQDALASGVEGSVLLRVVISTRGKISAIKVLEGLPRGLNDKAIECVRQWRFIPGKLNGRPVDVIAEIEVAFEITDKPKK